MKKIKLSELVNKSSYHETVADDELIKAILTQSKSWETGGLANWTKRTLIALALILAGFIAYFLYTILATNKFYILPTTTIETGNIINSGNINPEWETELLDNIEDILLDR